MRNYFKFKSPDVDISISFKDKFVLVQGDSNQGKSLFIAQLNSAIEAGMVEDVIDTDLRYYVVNSKKDLQHLKEDVDKGLYNLIIVDEFYAHKVMTTIVDCDCFALCITRKVCLDFNLSRRCFYKAVRDDSGVMKVYCLRKTYSSMTKLINGDA